MQEDGSNNWQPNPNDTVWVYYFNPHNREGAVTLGVRSLTFEKELPNYLNKDHNVRWVLVGNGKPFGQGYGVAYKPYKVHRTEEAARVALKRAVIEKMASLERALAEALKGAGTA